ncbi:hypothetical protein ACFLY3_04710 [Chloroflexota bacterium]
MTDKDLGEIYNTLPPVAFGDDKITILKHNIYCKGGEGDSQTVTGVELTIINTTNTVIGSALFQVTFYDTEGNILDIVEYKTLELFPNISRNLHITSSIPESDKIKSHQVRIVKTVMTPKPAATGNEKIKILKHSLLKAYDGEGRIDCPASTRLAIKNISGSTIATAIFEAIFYDIEGGILEIEKHREIELKPGCSRAIDIKSSITEQGKVKSYDINITRTITADVEKVQLRRQELRKTLTGEEDVNGTIKNISEVKTSAALVANFYNYKKEIIGTKVIIFRDIESNTVSHFRFLFKPQEGDKVKICTLHIAEIVE